MKKDKKLSQKIPWTLSIQNTVDFLAWRTKQLFGISKTELIKKTIKIVCQKENINDEYKKVENILKNERREARVVNRYSKSKSGLYIDPDEAMRRLRYFSEDYLNKEFDIFFNLVSDTYLNTFYSKIFSLKNGEWSTHGNGKSFKEFTLSVDSKFANILQMDNLAYNEKAKILIANELKLGAKAGKEQVLKYAYLFSKLKEFNLINKDDSFALLFIGTGEEIVTKNKIQTEVEFLKKENKKSKQKFIDKKIITIANNMMIKNITWLDIIQFNQEFLLGLNKKTQQTEIKLLQGFNSSLREKYLIQKK
jgi:hypothetical protein